MRCHGSSRETLEADNAAFALLMWNEKIMVDVSTFLVVNGYVCRNIRYKIVKTPNNRYEVWRKMLTFVN